MIAADGTIRQRHEQHFLALVFELRAQVDPHGPDLDIDLLLFEEVAPGAHLTELDPQRQVGVREIHIGEPVRVWTTCSAVYLWHQDTRFSSNTRDHTSPAPLDAAVIPLVNHTPLGALSTYSAPAANDLAVHTLSGDVALSVIVNVMAPPVGFWMIIWTAQQVLVEISVAVVGIASHTPFFTTLDGRVSGEFVMVSVYSASGYHTTSMKTFNCTKCGECCKRVDLIPPLQHLAGDGGRCMHLQENNDCAIYETRPKWCSINGAYDFVREIMTLDQWHQANYGACVALQARAAANTDRPQQSPSQIPTT